MKIHEYQAKELFRKFNVPTPKGKLAFTSDEVAKIGEEFGYPIVVKAQVHAGGRGKGGGVKLAKSKDDVKAVADSIIGMTLVTKQTGAQGKLVRKVLVEEGLNIKKELYLSIIPDRETATVAIVCSQAGGMDIEEVAAKTPEQIITVNISPIIGFQTFHALRVCFGLGLTDKALQKQMSALLKNLYDLFMAYDCSMVEINPLIITAEGNILALDAKMDIDNNSLFRHPDVKEMRDVDEENPSEVEASKYGLNYIHLDGNVGNIVNGAGLAMATMDIVKLAGASPANFLDVGGGANEEAIENGFRLIMKDPAVKGILINVFGGILRCDILAQGVVNAATKLKLAVPVVVRMEGTNVEEGRRILAESGLKLTTAKDLADAAEKVAKLVA